MRKLFWVFIFLFIPFIIAFPFYFVPQNRIHVHSNVKISADDIFKKAGPFYEIYSPKLPVSIKRGFFAASIGYNEPVIGNIKFLDGEFAITDKGHIIKTKSNKGESVLADMNSSEWSGEFSKLFYSLRIANELGNVKKLVLYGGLPAFYDKKGILVIIGYGNYNDKILEYKKALSLYKKKVDKMLEIDLTYKDEAVITWREQ